MGNQRGTPDNMVRNRRLLDALPRELRAVIVAAPYDLHSNWFKDWRKAYGPDVGAARRELIRRIAKSAAPFCAETYGPDHPCVARFQAIAEGRAL